MSVRSRAVDAVFVALEAVVSLYDFVRNLRRPEPEPFPLQHRDSKRIVKMWPENERQKRR